MKKLFTLLTMLIVGIGSMWADETYTIIDNAAGGVWSNGSYSSDNGTSTWKGSWTSTSTTPQITVSAHTWLLQNNTGYIGSSNAKTGNFTISINDGYLITGYEIKFENVNTDGSHNQTITPNGKSDVTAKGTGSATVAVTGLNTRAAYFKLTGENSLAKVTKFTVTYVSSSTWTSGVTGVGGSSNYYSNTWYLKLTTPNAGDVFLDNFTLGIASDGTHDTELETYLAFSQGKFSEQNNHKASEFLAISSNSISDHSSATANIKEFVFDETVRLNGNTDVYVCFVSKNVDGTYNLQKRGLAVKNIGEASGLKICNDNNYTTTENSCGNNQCQYSCAYSTTYNYPQTVPDDYHIWSGINNGDRTDGGKIAIACMKYTTPGTSGQYIHFDRFSLSFRNDSDVPWSKHLLFSKNCLIGTDVLETTEFDPSNFSAISTNTFSANGVFTFAFDSDSYLEGGETYYIYMGTKLSNGKFTLFKYGLFINHEMNQKGIETGFQYYKTVNNTELYTENNWQPIYYSSKCTFADQKVTVNIKEAGTTIRTKTLYSDTNIDLATTLNIPSIYTVTPTSITHTAGSSSQDVTIDASFKPSSAPATENNKRYFIKLNGKYAGGENGKSLSASTDMSENDQWVIGGNYYDGYTFYNVGQAKYLSVQNGDNSQGTFVAESSASKFIAGTNSTGFGFRLLGSRFCYLNDHAGSNVLSTWKDASAATGEGSRVVIEDPTNLLSDVYTQVLSKKGTTLGKYTHPSISLDEIDATLANAELAYSSGGASDKITSILALKNINNGLVLNMPVNNTFLRIKSNSQTGYYLSNENNQYGNINRTNTLNAKETIYLFKDNHLINYDNGLVISERYADYEAKYFPTMGEVGATPTTINFSAAAAESLYNIGFKDNTRSLKINEYASDAGESGQTGGDYDFILQEVTSLPVTIKSSALGYATFCCPVPVVIPSGVEAYVSRIKDNTISLFKIENIKDAENNVVIPANTAVMLHNSGDVSKDLPVSFNISNYSGEGITGNGFSGTIAAETMKEGDSYYSLRVLKVNGVPTKVGFAAKAPGGTLAGFKGWIHEKGQNARNFTIVFDGDSDPTGIVEALGLENDNVEIYDLNGRKLSSYKKGINIVNGKKVMVQ